MKAHFARMAAYNRWANARLYAAALDLPDADYRRDVGVFFKSLHGTFNHLLVTDRGWLNRLAGLPEHAYKLNAILHEDRRELARARADEDERFVACVAALDNAALAGALRYANSTGQVFEQKRSDILAHLCNHQAHHRGQAHAALSIRTGREPPPLDLLAMQRGGEAPDLRALAAASDGTR